MPVMISFTVADGFHTGDADRATEREANEAVCGADSADGARGHHAGRLRKGIATCDLKAPTSWVRSKYA